MNCIKAKLISVKNRLVRVIQRRRRSTASRRTETPRRRIASLLRMRLRLRLQRRQREQRAASRDQEQCEDGSAPSEEDDATSARVVIEVEIPTTPSPTNTLSLSSFMSLSPTSFTISSYSSDDEEDYVDDADLSSVYFDCEEEEDGEDGNTTENDLTESDYDADSSSTNNTLSPLSNDGDDDDQEDSFRERGSSIAVVECRTTCFGGAVTLLSECSSEEELSGDRNQERASGVENRELHQTNLSDNNVFQWWEDRLHSAVELCTSRDDDAVSQTSSMEELKFLFEDDENNKSSPQPTQPSLPHLSEITAHAQIDTSQLDTSQRQCDTRNQQQQNEYSYHQISAACASSQTRAGNDGHSTTGQQTSTLQYHVPGSAFSGAGCNPRIGQFVELGRHFITHPHHLPTNYHHDPYLPFTHHSTGQMPQYQQASQQFHGLVQPTGPPDQQYYSIWNFGQYQQSLQGAVGGELFPAYIVIPDAPPVPVESTAPPQSTAASHGISKLITEQKHAPSSSRKRKPAPLSLSLGDNDKPISPCSPSSPPPPLPSASGPSAAAERKWADYVANRSSSPEYFLYPPFTADQEEWIVQVNHPFKDSVLQSWQEKIHSSIEKSLKILV